LFKVEEQAKQEISEKQVVSGGFISRCFLRSYSWTLKLMATNFSETSFALKGLHGTIF
jgi:hypothetical protein